MCSAVDQSGSEADTDPSNGRLTATAVMADFLSSVGSPGLVHRMAVVHFGSSAPETEATGLLALPAGAPRIHDALTPRNLGAGGAPRRRHPGAPDRGGAGGAVGRGRETVASPPASAQRVDRDRSLPQRYLDLLRGELGLARGDELQFAGPGAETQVMVPPYLEGLTVTALSADPSLSCS